MAISQELQHQLAHALRGVGTADEVEVILEKLDNISTTELGWLDSVTPGTQAASKAVIADANVNTGVHKVTELHIGTSGAEVQVTATALELNQAADVTGQIVTASATPLAITEALHNNRTIYITKTDGIAITLPVPVAGMKFKFVVGATITSASTIKSVAGTHLMIGHAIMGNDEDNTTVRWPALAASAYDTINLYGTANSTGGIEGQVILITGLSTTRWLVEIIGDAAGTEATPFEDTVA